VAFPFYMDGVIVNIKYRALPKYFHQVMGGSQIFYGYDEAQVRLVDPATLTTTPQHGCVCCRSVQHAPGML